MRSVIMMCNNDDLTKAHMDLGLMKYGEGLARLQ